MVRFFKEIYFTAFTIFFRLRISEPLYSETGTLGYNKGKGVACVSMIEGLTLMAIMGWIEIFVGKRFFSNTPKWVLATAFLTLCFANHHVLVIRGHGVAFEHEFTHFKKSQKVVLLASCMAMMLAAIGFVIYSGLALRKLTHPS